MADVRWFLKHFNSHFLNARYKILYENKIYTKNIIYLCYLEYKFIELIWSLVFSINVCLNSPHLPSNQSSIRRKIHAYSKNIIGYTQTVSLCFDYYETTISHISN